MNSEKATPVRTEVMVKDYVPSYIDQITSETALCDIVSQNVSVAVSVVDNVPEYIATTTNWSPTDSSSEESYDEERDTAPFPEKTHEPIFIPIDVDYDDIEPMQYSIDYSEVIALDTASKKQETVEQTVEQTVEPIPDTNSDNTTEIPIPVQPLAQIPIPVQIIKTQKRVPKMPMRFF
jgi:hypothetical protein